jgi:hypothetical protein
MDPPYSRKCKISTSKIISSVHKKPLTSLVVSSYEDELWEHPNQDLQVKFVSGHDPYVDKLVCL